MFKGLIRKSKFSFSWNYQNHQNSCENLLIAMSTRYIKKVYGTDLIPKHNELEDTSDIEEPIIRDVKPKNFNAFSLVSITKKD